MLYISKFKYIISYVTKQLNVIVVYTLLIPIQLPVSVIMSSLSNGIFNENQPLLEKLTHGYHPMTEGVRWTEKYADKLEHIFSKLPKFVTSILATLAIFILGTSLQGKIYKFFDKTYVVMLIKISYHEISYQHLHLHST